MKINKIHNLLGPIPFILTIVGVLICLLSAIAIVFALYVLFYL